MLLISPELRLDAWKTDEIHQKVENYCETRFNFNLMGVLMEGKEDQEINHEVRIQKPCKQMLDQMIYKC